MARTLVKEIKDTRKNYVINGNLDIWQRGTSVTFTTNNYILDRWFAGATGSVNYSRQSTGAAVGSTNYARFTFPSSGNSINDFYYMENTDVNPLKGNWITYSMLMRRTGTFSDIRLRIGKNATANTRLGGAWSEIASKTITNAEVPVSTGSASDWVRFSVSVFVPNDGTANGLRINLVLTSSSVGATMEISQIQVNVGTVVAPFSLYAENLEGELAACQRYYEKSYDLETTPGTATLTGVHFLVTPGGGAGEWSQVKFKVRKRATSTCTVYNPNASNVTGVARNYTDSVDVSPVNLTGQIGEVGVNTAGTVPAAGKLVGFHWIADSEI